MIDGIDYVYTITAYDRGLKSSTTQLGSYNDETGLWTNQVDHTFTEEMEANYYHYNKLSYNIETSYINNDNTYMYHLDVPLGYPESFTSAEKIDIFLSTNPDNYYDYIDSDGNKQGFKSLESSKIGETVSWHNEDTGNSGTFTPTRDYTDKRGRRCRNFKSSITVNKETSNSKASACRITDSAWRAV